MTASNNYQLMIPLISLLAGIFFLGLFQIRRPERSAGLQWMMQSFFLILALCQELLLYQVPTTLYVNGGLILDGTTSLFSIAVLGLALFVHGCRIRDKKVLSPQINILSLCGTLFALATIESNQVLFTGIAFLALIWTTQGALAADSLGGDQQPDLVHSGMYRGVLFLFLGIVLAVLCFACFGSIQSDEMQRALVRGSIKAPGLFAIEVFILFMGALIMGLPPFQGIFGKGRQQASWTLSVGSTGLFALVGFNFLIRWGLLIFARPAIGGIEMEPLTTLNFLHLLRALAAASLILIPVLTLVQRQIRGSLLFFCLNPFAQALFALSFGQRELMGFVLAQVLVATFSLGVLVTGFQVMNLAPQASFQDWIGLGRRSRAACLTVILAASVAAGIPPFFGSLLLQKTLSINSAFAFFPLLNLGLSGFCVARLVILAFHRTTPQIATNPLSLGQKFWFAAQLMALILMGIFWQPLYKYGAFSIRGFFGEL